MARRKRVGAELRAAATGATICIAVTAAPVLRVLTLVRIDRLIDIHPSVAAARASLPSCCHDALSRYG